MNYTLNQLEIFQKIVQTKSITKAADLLHLTQPAVSIQLKNLQDQFDIALTEKVGRQIYITDFGLEVAESIENILNQVYALNFKTMAFKGQLGGKLKISIVSTGKYVMPYFLTDFIRKHTGIELLMDVTNKSKVVESLKNNEVNFALVSILPEKVPVEKIDLLQNNLFLVGRDELPSKNKILTEEVFQNLPLILREKGSGTRQTMDDFIQSNKIPVLRKMELTSNEAIKQALLAGLGYSIMPLIGIKSELQSGELKIIPVQGLPIQTTWSLVWLKGKKHSPVSAAFLRHLISQTDNIVRDHFSWYEKYR